MQPVTHALADLLQRFVVLRIEIDGLAETAAEQQRLEGPRANDDRRNGQRDERPGHRRHLFQWRTAVVAVPVVIMGMIVVPVITMRAMTRFGMRLVLFVRGMRGTFFPARLAMEGHEEQPE